jgi:esterase/lipase superfamily enzyme
MGTVVYGHWGPPLLAFPTSHGDEWELDRHGLIAAMAEFIATARVPAFR